ncbi:hypothetical protein SSABA_v1c08980 [Spiroplasma sabaudiense Ar-1343]|uniref:Lipoprotein n=1 Tax=Spiroplasma sabaudiense Ar-1343 TaxID=1276257 RepID=W6AB71_9MOLU|nr:lipoprotein [Spiroplasma sabaudiense]AHI54297.1 hypothetical protein SSABA_v1c08980 [Spiroplasma sabaudiense Ar-1343]
MKKLLSILAATTMVVSAPLSVVACGDEGGKIGKEFDFEEAKADFMRDATQVYQNSLSKDFEKYFFTSQEDIDDDQIFERISTSYLNEIVGSGSPIKVIEPNSKEFNEISKDLKKIPNLDNLKKSADSQIVKNVNYRSLLVDGKNPFANSEVDFLTISVLKLDEDLFSIQFKTESTYVLKDKTGEEAYETVNYMSSITIFKERNASQEMKEISKKIEAELNSKEFANSFNFESESGQVNENVKNLSKSSNVGTKFVEAGNKVKSTNANWKDYTFKTDSLKVESSVDKFVPASPKMRYLEGKGYGVENYKITTWPNYHPAFTWGTTDDDYLNFWNNFGSNNSEDSLKDFLNAYQVYETTNKKWVHKDNISRPLKATAIEKDNSWTTSFNPFFNQDGKDPIISNIQKNSSNFALSQTTNLSSNTDAKLMGVYDSEVKGFNLEYKSKITSNTVKIEMPSIQIGVRQNATKATIDVQKEFFAAQFAFFKQLYGYNDNNSTFSNFNFSVPEKFDSEIEVDKFYEAEDFFSAMFDEAKAKVIAKNPEHEKYINHFAVSNIIDQKNQVEYIKISRNLDLSFYNSEKTPLKSWFFSPGASYFSKGSYGPSNIIGKIGFTMATDYAIEGKQPKAIYRVKFKSF